MDLPVGLTHRPLTPADAQPVFAVMAEQEAADIGRVDIELADIVADWQRPSFDVADSTVGVFEGDVLVAYAELTDVDRSDAAVTPRWRGQGIGAALAHWLQVLARSRGHASVSGNVPEGSPGDRLLSRLGYDVRWTSWVLALPEGCQVPARELPPGYSIRTADAADLPAVWTVVEGAFLEWSDRERAPFEDFLATSVRRPGFEPWQLRVVTDPVGDVVGVALLVMAGEQPVEAFVDKLAVRADQRRRGLAEALLVDAFTQGIAHGADTCGLATDTRSGALGLYRSVGMEVVDTWVNRGLRL